jgi:cytochrome c-type biogenesis protein CcmH
MALIGRSGFVALAAVVIAVGAIGYRIFADHPAAGPAAAAAPADPLADLERKAQASPDDAAAWQKLGFAQFDRQNYDAAVSAYERATAINPRDAVLWSSLGEARVMASRRDPMPPAALDAFRKAVALDAKDPRARYFLAVQKDLQGDHKGAIADWLALLKDTPAGAPWDGDLQRTIDQVGKINKIDVASRIAAAERKAPPAIADAAMPVAARAIPGPSADDLRNASAIPPGQQREMAEGMVSRLEARLQGEPKNVDGWIMLMRSRMTLGEPDKAAAALKAAVAANPGEAARLREQAAMLGVK